MLEHSDRRSTRRWAKIGPPLRGRVRKPAGFVATLARGPTGPRCAPLLSSGLPDAIGAIQNGRKALYHPRFGFVSTPRVSDCYPEPNPNFMCLTLSGETPEGRVTYHPAFGAD